MNLLFPLSFTDCVHRDSQISNYPIMSMTEGRGDSGRLSVTSPKDPGGPCPPGGPIAPGGPIPGTPGAPLGPCNPGGPASPGWGRNCDWNTRRHSMCHSTCHPPTQQATATEHRKFQPLGVSTFIQQTFTETLTGALGTQNKQTQSLPWSRFACKKLPLIP